MKAFIFAASLLALASPAMAADINVSVNLGQPDFYGPLEVQNYGQPRVIYTNPIIIQRPVNYVNQAPIYLRVPPGHAKNWSKHCAAYNACGQRVLFVQDTWYNNTYAPRYRKEHGEHDDNRGYGKPAKQEKYEKQDKHEKHDKHDKHDDDHGNGNGNGHGKGHNKG
jgi:hypothetical protein